MVTAEESAASARTHAGAEPSCSFYASNSFFLSSFLSTGELLRHLLHILCADSPGWPAGSIDPPIRPVRWCMGGQVANGAHQTYPSQSISLSLDRARPQPGAKHPNSGSPPPPLFDFDRPAGPVCHVPSPFFGSRISAWPGHRSADASQAICLVRSGICRFLWQGGGRPVRLHSTATCSNSDWDSSG